LFCLSFDFKGEREEGVYSKRCLVSEDFGGRQTTKTIESQTGSESVASETSSVETGADETGADETGADETGADETGADETGADETGVQVSGTIEASVRQTKTKTTDSPDSAQTDDSCGSGHSGSVTTQTISESWGSDADTTGGENSSASDNTGGETAKSDAFTLGNVGVGLFDDWLNSLGKSSVWLNNFVDLLDNWSDNVVDDLLGLVFALGDLDLSGFGRDVLLGDSQW
jgi:hypothetical protein